MIDEPKNDWPGLREPPETVYVGSDPFRGITRVLIIADVLVFVLWFVLMLTLP